MARARRVDGYLLAMVAANMVVAKATKEGASKVANARKAKASMVAAVEKEKEEVQTTTPAVFAVNKDTGETNA